MNSTGIDKLKEHWRVSWTPPPRLSAWEWCENNVFMPAQATPKPGRYSTDSVPYVRTPMECWTDNETKIIVLKWSAQSTKTTCEFMCMAHDVKNYLGNILFNMPSEPMAKSKAETVWFPIINSSPALKTLKPSNKNKFKILEQHMRNGVVNFIGGNSATNLASRSAGRIFTDEIDKLKAQLINEADPLSLLFERAEWFPNPKIFLTSTPTVPEGHINQWFLKGTQEYFYYPCPDCGEFFTAKWKHVKWDGSETLTQEEKAKSAYIECPHCTYRIKNKHKRQMLAQGEWRSHNEGVSKKIRSFHFNRIMSPVSKLSDMVEKFLQARERAKTGDIGELKNFVNSALSEVWNDEKGKVKTLEYINGLVDQTRHRGEIPDEALGLVAGVDTQDDGFYYAIHAFGVSNTSWLVAEGFLHTFEDIEKVLLESEYDGREVEAIFMDAAGHRTDEVYKFCRKHIDRVVPCFGRSGNMENEYTWTQVDKIPGITTVGGLRRLAWKTIWIKDMLFAKMNVGSEDPGSFHIHADACMEYKKALTSEYKDEKGTYTHRKHIPNHYLDCTALAFLGSWIMNIEYRVPESARSEIPEGMLTNYKKEDNKLW